MRIGYPYEDDAADASVPSGRPYAILQEVISRGWTVIPAFLLYPKFGRSFSWKTLCYRSMGRIYRPDLETALLEELAVRARRAGEWKRKGPPKVIQACHWLAGEGVGVTLDLIAAEIYGGARPGFARFHCSLIKATEDARTRIERLLTEAYVLFVPSLAEDDGIAFWEAAAYGVPAVTTNVGGLSTIVHHDLIGLTFSVDASPKEFAASMLQVFGDRKRYETLALLSYEEYDMRVNWRAFGSR